MKMRIFGAGLAVAAAVFCSLATPADTAHAADAPYSWRTVPWGGGGYVDGFVYHPKVKDVLYARTDVGGAFRYDFAAKRWISLLNDVSRADGHLIGVLSMAVDPNDANKVYLANGLYLGEWAHTGAVLRSDDRGATWTKTDLPIRLGGNADGRGAGERLQVDPNQGDVLFLGSNQDGLWKSADGAKIFTKVGGFSGANVSLVLIDPASGAKGAPSQTIYVGGGHPGSADDKGGLWVSRDGGSSFALVPGAPRQTPQRAALGPDGFLYVTFAAGDGKNKSDLNPSNVVTGGVWKMDLKTGKWKDISPAKPILNQRQFGYSGIDVDPAHPGAIITSTIDRWWPEPDDIFLSRDGGAHWTALRAKSRFTTRFPWREGEGMGSWLSDVKLNPFDPDEMIYGNGGGVWMTRNLSAADSGKTVEFDFAVDDLEETAIIQMVSPPAGATLIAALGDVGGGSWDDVTKSPPASALFQGGTHRSVDVAWLKPAFVARSLDNKPFGYYSEDGGIRWTAFPSAPPYTPQDAQGNWRTMGKLAVSAEGTSIVWTIPRDKAYYSFDKGATWTPSTGLPQDTQGRLVAVADRAVNGVFYVHDRPGGQILISVDGGKSFKSVIKGVPAVADWEGSELAVAPGRARDLWLGGSFGLLHSGEPAKPMAAIKDVEQAWSISFGKAPPGRTYSAVFLAGKVKGQTGLWRSDDEGQSWARIHAFNDSGVLAGDPLEYGTVYVSRGSGGIIVGKIAQ